MKFTKAKLIEIINEVNFEKVTIPAKTKRFLEKFIEAMKDEKLNRIKRAAILYKVIDGAGMTPETLMKDIQKIKKSLKKEGGPGSGPQSDDDNPFDKEPSDDDLRDIEKQFEGKLEEGRFKLSPRSEMHWGMDKVVVLSGNKKVVLTRKELAALLKGAKMHKLTKEEKLSESFQKNHFLNLIKQEIESLKGQIAYSKDKVNYKGTPDWEKKEFKAVLKDKIKNLKDTEKHYKRVQKLKEGKLDEAGSIGGPIDSTDIYSNYTAPKRDTENVKNQGVFLQQFSSSEARKIIDGQLKNMVNDIRKVEGRVIKTWMTAAKAGKIDFFDIIRGLKTGDIRRAHSFEMDFFVNLLTRNKIVDRFRSYFNGKKGKAGRTK